MAARSMQAARCPTDELSLSNCAVVNEKDFQSGQCINVASCGPCLPTGCVPSA